MKTLSNASSESVKTSLPSNSTKWSKFKDLAGKYSEAALYGSISASALSYTAVKEVSNLSSSGSKTYTTSTYAISMMALVSAFVAAARGTDYKKENSMIKLSKSENASIMALTASTFVASSMLYAARDFMMGGVAYSVGLMSILSYLPIKRIVEDSAITIGQKAKAIGSIMTAWAGVGMFYLGAKNGGIHEYFDIKATGMVGQFANLGLDYACMLAGIGVAVLGVWGTNRLIQPKKQAE